jgi:hypothetical protein
VVWRLAAFALSLSLAACGHGALGVAVETQNTMVQGEVLAADMLEENCTAGYTAVLSVKDAAAVRQALQVLDSVCPPAREGYGVARAARLGLLAAITAYRATGDDAQLGAALARAVAAATEMAAAVQRLRSARSAAGVPRS